MESASEPPLRVTNEKFAMYGLELKIPSDWRVEVNPKGTRAKGDVAFHGPKGNKFFVSWGPLENATKRFKTLEEHREANIERVKKGQDVKSTQVSDLNETQIGGHRALQSHVLAQVRGGMMSRGLSQREIWSAHFYCEPSSRYYVVYSLVRDPDEFENMASIFQLISMKIVCHT